MGYHRHDRVIENLSDEEMARRSLLMRLYHSRIHGDWYYPKGFVNGHAPGLLEQGWIAEVGEGYRLTATGVREWAGMVKPLLLSSNHSEKGQSNELKAYCGLPLRQMKLEQGHRDYLAALAAAGGTLSITTYNAEYLGALVQGVYIVLVGEVVEMTVVGWMEVNLTNQAGREERTGQALSLRCK